MKERTTVRYLGVDIGTTTVTALGMEVETGEVVSVQTAANACEITTVADRKRGRSEWDAKRMAELTQEVIGRAAAETGEVAGIGVTGQMHGMLLVSEKGDPIGPFVGWQDRRGMEPMPGGDGSYVDRMRAVAQEVGAKGCRPTSGYLGTTLFWLAQQGFLPDEAFTASFLPDYIVAVLTGSRPVTDATDAAGTGLYDVLEGDWHTELIEALGLSEKWLSEVLASGTRVGGLTRTVAAFTELPEGLPVFVACGDNQASFAGSVRVYENSLLVNVGTGGQVSAHVERALSAEGLEARPFMDGAFLMVGAGLVGGRSYAWLRDFFREVGGAFFGGQSDEDLYEQMNKLAAGTPSGCDGLRCEPLFTGTRREPNRRGVWSGVGAANFTPGHMARAVLEGIAEQFRLLYGEIEGLGAGGRTQLVGAGNGIRKNALLREILQERFEMEMAVPMHTEEAAFGAALMAAVGSGTFESLAEAGKVIQYR